MKAVTEDRAGTGVEGASEFVDDGGGENNTPLMNVTARVGNIPEERIKSSIPNTHTRTPQEIKHARRCQEIPGTCCVRAGAIVLDPGRRSRIWVFLVERPLSLNVKPQQVSWYKGR